MSLYLNHTKTISINRKVSISGSKSESNRLLILQQLFPGIQLENLSNSDDTKLLQKALGLSVTNDQESEIIDIAHAGTAMRFLTAYFAIQENKTTTLTGSKRMQERPIKVLVDALLEIGATIEYLKKEGYPPLLIKGKKLTKNKVSIRGDVSSQYISALLLIAPTFPNGFELELAGKVTSIPYITMTLTLLNSIGIHTEFNDKKIIVAQYKNLQLKSKTYIVEPDWSSASYFYSLVALQANSKIELTGFKKKSLQGDSVLPKIYKYLGVQTVFHDKGISIINNPIKDTQIRHLNLDFDLNNTPDLAQTIAVTCLGLGIDCHLKGLHTLKIKETDRLQALKNELEKFGAKVTLTATSLCLKSPEQLVPNRSVATYQDHRMAMAFAPLSLKVPLLIENPNVVTKSYPEFWKDFNSIFAL